MLNSRSSSVAHLTPCGTNSCFSKECTIAKVGQEKRKDRDVKQNQSSLCFASSDR